MLLFMQPGVFMLLCMWRGVFMLLCMCRQGSSQCYAA